METIGIIGFGNFGRFMARQLKPHFKVSVYDEKFTKGKGAKQKAETKTGISGVKAAPLKEAASKEIVILAVPVEGLESTLKKIRPHLVKGALVVDICSVKAKPVVMMRKILPKNVEIIGTHPLFGPQSGRKGIAGMTIIFCPVRTKRGAKTKKFLQKTLKLRVVEMTPEAHDRLMAKTQAVAHFIGRALNELDIPENQFNLATYGCLAQLVGLVQDDSDELFRTIQRENPYAGTERERLLRKLWELERAICKPRRGA